MYIQLPTKERVFPTGFKLSYAIILDVCTYLHCNLHTCVVCTEMATHAWCASGGFTLQIDSSDVPALQSFFTLTDIRQ